jgi:hypothetical protein
LYTRVAVFAVAALALQFGLLWWEGIRSWGKQDGHANSGFAFVTLFPALYLLAGLLSRKRYPPFAPIGIFTGIVLLVTLPISPSAMLHFPYPQFGGALILTILLAGLLVGKSYVRVWTLACVMVQFSDDTQSWRVNALWGLLHLTAGWLVGMFSWHVIRAPSASASGWRIRPVRWCSKSATAAGA